MLPPWYELSFWDYDILFIYKLLFLTFLHNSFYNSYHLNTLSNMNKTISILLLTQLNKDSSIRLMESALGKLVKVSSLVLYTQDAKMFPQTLQYSGKATDLDYIVSIGQNSTIMKAFRTMEKTEPVPVISISDGDQSIMSSYSSCDMDQILDQFINGLFHNNLRIMQTLRFDIFNKSKKEPHSKFSCELEINRDMRKSVLALRIHTKIEGNKFFFLTSIYGDGLIISTPLGSMGRNLNLSGPIIFKSIQSITIVPINPLSLNFRPIILPAHAQIIVEVEKKSRSSALVFADRELVENLPPGEQILIKRSGQSTKLIKGLSKKSTQQIWINCLREVISYGQAYNDTEKQKQKQKEEKIEKKTKQNEKDKSKL